MITAGHLLVAGAFRGTGWALPLAVDLHAGTLIIFGSKFVGDGCKTRRSTVAADVLIHRGCLHHLSPITGPREWLGRRLAFPPSSKSRDFHLSPPL
jgi:hypothetical protein